MLFVESLFEAVPDHLQNQVAVRAAGRMVSGFQQPVEELPCVGQIEVSGQQQRPVQAGVGPDKRMAGVHALPAECPVSQVSQIEFAAERITPQRLLRRRRSARLERHQ
ncbi:hypothetical protein SDC9_157550 [bioreactor metagenome]|uniref:Uncharacterized protein n=1 Tax=bioreactor metagenome TaxID=1076179 RepID=A0A645F7A2_9ZZZZ